jgi:GDP-4-dehydro-6-deoxy-D-mannose reductase
MLVTGPAGFVGTHLRPELGDAFVPFEGDVLDADALAAAVREAQPSALVHLAADSSVAASWENPTRVWRVNVGGTVNVLEAVRRERPEARVLFPSTSEVYGNASRFPTPEDEPVRPISPYAVTKAAAELACALPGVEVVLARSFNHEGPGRDDRFAIGSWTRQIARLETEGGGTLLVGDLSAERDVTDVRDVARAYRLLLDPSVGLARVPVQVVRDESRLRPVDIGRLCGDPSKLQAATGWEPAIPLEQTLADALAAARELEPVS